MIAFARARTSDIRSSANTAFSIVARAVWIRAVEWQGRAVLLHVSVACLSQKRGEGGGEGRCLGVSFLSSGVRTDEVHEHALPQLSLFPLCVLSGKTTTKPHVAPSAPTQCDCMVTLSSKSPVQIGFCWKISGGKRSEARARTLLAASRMASGPAAIESRNEASVRRERVCVCMMSSG